ncbi:cytochrome c [Flavobacterium glaciei]|uniref:Cytochrome c n=2 Tax=Flavobacterium glaciei TaxID=386300 RepID=A0A562PX83_9FLAO|nr:cytochrome c [Flavobacterium glaciei]RDI56449.1 cytochrome c [Flavobacterium glaciei]TWI49019.1 cytochrome c [Flavobacterium glaciei]
MMLTTKLFLGFGMFVLGNFSFENPFSAENYRDLNTEITANSKLQSPGKEIYADFCMQCHGANGKGDTKNFPPLDGSDWLKTKRNESIAAVKFGQSGEIVVNKIKYNSSMPTMGLTNQEVADVMNYIMTSWSNKQTKIVTEEEVAAIKK